MLRRNADEAGLLKWRLFAKMNEHGRYDQDVSEEECLALAREIKEYENAFLTHQISFLETIYEYFVWHGLWHDQELYNHQMRRFLHGEPVNVMVYHARRTGRSPDYKSKVNFSEEELSID